MEKTIFNNIKSFKDNTIILSVSGGVDSLVLFDILYKLKLKLVVVHFNHLQREQAFDEASYLKTLCERLNVPFHYFELKVKDNLNFHNQAHQLRNKHLIEVASMYNTNVIVTAHHLNDLAESILFKLSRGSNLLGYAGMNENYLKDGYYYLKPLLYIPKNNLLKYAKVNNVFYFEDQSNLADDYQRNKIRHNVIPYLIEQNPQFLNKIKQYNLTLLQSFSYIRKKAIEFLKDENYFMISQFLLLDEVIQNEIISYLLEKHNLSLSLIKIKSIISFLKKSGPNDSYNIGKNIIMLRAYNKVSITTLDKQISFKQKLDLKQINTLPDGSIIIFNNTSNEKLNNEVNLCYNRLVMPLWARTRQNGDVLYFPFGHKKLKDFFIDKKIPKHIRDKSIIITDNNNQILAVLGLYINTNPELKDSIQLFFRRTI